MFSSLVQTTPHIKSGKLRALGTGGEKRSPVLPDVPTIAEAGVPGYEALNWWGIVAPAGTPQPIVERLHKALADGAGLAGDPEAVRQGRRRVVQMSSAEFGKFIESEMNKWERVVKEAGSRRSKRDHARRLPASGGAAARRAGRRVTRSRNRSGEHVQSVAPTPEGRPP